MISPIQNAWRLPWKGRDVPHALLDITRRCNISCKSCYNTEESGAKTLDEVKAELEQLMSIRRLNSISIVGGEPTLHPSLEEIIRLIRSKGLYAELFTNGLLLDDEMTARLGKAGLNVAFLHVQKDQKRPDLASGAATDAIEKLLNGKIESLRDSGIDAGLSITTYGEDADELLWAVDYCIRTPHLNYLLATMDRDVRGMPEIDGDISDGMKAVKPSAIKCRDSGLDMKELVEKMRIMKFRPFCYIGSNIDKFDPRWVSFMSICAYDGGVLRERLSLTSSLVEKFYIHVERTLKNRYPFYTKIDQGMLKIQLTLNGIFGGRFFEGIEFMRKIRGRKYELNAKRLLFQSPAYVDDSGQVIHCANCPDAVLKNGRMVPVCICDKFRSKP